MKWRCFFVTMLVCTIYLFSIDQIIFNSCCEHFHHWSFRSWICDRDPAQYDQEDAKQLLVFALRSPDQGAKGWHQYSSDDAEPRQVYSTQACLSCKFSNPSWLQYNSLMYYLELGVSSYSLLYIKTFSGMPFSKFSNKTQQSTDYWDWWLFAHP